MKLANRTFVVSGGSSGLGLASVIGLLKLDAFVAILDTKAPPPNIEQEHSSSTLTSSSSSRLPSPRLLYTKADITVLAEVESAIERIIIWTETTGARLGGLLNAAGIARGGQIVNRKGEPHSVTDWDLILAVNLSGTFHLSSMVAKHLVRVPKEDTPDGERGVIIMVSSSVAYEGQAGQVAYAATKGAINSMTLPASRDLAEHNIRVVTIVPSPFDTPMTDNFFSERTDTSLKKNVVIYPRRYGLPEEFAATVRWILECPFVNGENIRLSGGVRVPAVL
ncbi:3-hydroxyacyl-CoA dehydrogenase [Gymnopus androsaceus JB14]|uniref:3-hydroxyacyl-CoA dehydrogenase n=1 Tax=Gymnopus androsaceus JB14 TaxID=1447944 RepID=A0A6A4GQY0_9AGAR|nr:3-hydroxyacyl-CoA dehydrogenase [Gymnopus androsaceus JB14]